MLRILEIIKGDIPSEHFLEFIPLSKCAVAGVENTRNEHNRCLMNRVDFFAWTSLVIWCLVE